MRTFLTDNEVRELTKFSQAAKQKQHLKKEGIPFTEDKFGKPIVLREALLKTPTITYIEPNWG